MFIAFCADHNNVILFSSSDSSSVFSLRLVNETKQIKGRTGLFCLRDRIVGMKLHFSVSLSPSPHPTNIIRNSSFFWSRADLQLFGEKEEERKSLICLEKKYNGRGDFFSAGLCMMRSV
jgi:hypothetical protein